MLAAGAAASGGVPVGTRIKREGAQPHAASLSGAHLATCAALDASKPALRCLHPSWRSLATAAPETCPPPVETDARISPCPGVIDARVHAHSGYDNPVDPSALTAQQAARSIVVTLEQTYSFQVRLES